MKFLVQAVPDSPFAGFEAAAKSAGHQWVWWDEKHTAAFDVFDEVKPDIFCCVTRSNAVKKVLREYSHVVVWRSSIENPFTFYLNMTEVEFKGLVDTHNFYPVDEVPELKCQIGMCCEPNPAALNLCNFPYNIKIMSDKPWPVSQYLGKPTPKDKRDLYCSSDQVIVDNMLEAMRVMACGRMVRSYDEKLIEHKYIGSAYFDLEYKEEDWEKEKNMVKDARDYARLNSYGDALKNMMETSLC